MEAQSGEFLFTRLEKVIFGAGQVPRLADELDCRRLQRVVVTGKSVGHSKLLDRVTNALDSRCVHVFTDASQHVPAQSVRALAETLRRVDADAAVSFGGGSAIDATKAAIASILNHRDMTLEGGDLDWASAFAARDQGKALSHVAISTTLSAAEYTPGGGVDLTGDFCTR